MHSIKFFPCLHDFIQSSNGYVDSELLFVDRYISLARSKLVADRIASVLNPFAFTVDHCAGRVMFYSEAIFLPDGGEQKGILQISARIGWPPI
jgi:hypothetical protein